MRTAVIRVIVDREGTLTGAEYEAGVGELRTMGFEVVHTPVAHLPERNREVELIVEDSGPEPHGAEFRGAEYVEVCSRIFGTKAVKGVVTYISRGTDDDARGILSGFGLSGDVTRAVTDDEELVTVTVSVTDQRRVPESRLHTALESALNCEVRIVYT